MERSDWGRRGINGGGLARGWRRGLFFLLLPLSLFAAGARFPSEGALARLVLVLVGGGCALWCKLLCECE